MSDEMTPTERSALVTWELARGRTLTPDDVARLTECHVSSGYRVLERLARVIPLYEENGHWRTVTGETVMSG